eukprot:SAG31_NODE_42680_length_270_cov_0.900585_1_plen_48_part_10
MLLTFDHMAQKYRVQVLLRQQLSKLARQPDVYAQLIALDRVAYCFARR